MHVYRRKGGRPAFTRVRVREAFGRFVWFEAWPETSRQMQVQAHMAAVGAPVLGDAAHGVEGVELRLSDLKRGYKGREEEKPLIKGLALQATAVTLRHPETREPISWEAELPGAFAIALRNLRKYARG
jgi:23S rRNA-/tRNA-specific pseudouridylate synthase